MYTGLAVYLSRRAEELRALNNVVNTGGQGKGKGGEQEPPVVVLEVGAGTGELAHHLRYVRMQAVRCCRRGGWIGG